MDSPLAFMATACGGFAVASLLAALAALWSRDFAAVRVCLAAGLVAAIVFLVWIVVSMAILVMGG